MVSTSPHPSRPADGATVEAVRARIDCMPDRFVSWNGTITVGLDRLALLVAEILTEHTTDLVTQLDQASVENAALCEQLNAEQDAANDAINELHQQLEDARAGREDPPRRVYESGEAFLSGMDGLRGDLERGA